MTILELVLALFIGGMILLLIQYMYRAMYSASADVRDVTDIQRQLRIGAAKIKKELSNAGAGLTGGASIPAFDSTKITILYRDLLNRHCPNDSEVVTLEYEARADTLVETVSCDGALAAAHIVLIAPEPIQLSFKYLDHIGNPVSLSDSVKIIEYTIELSAVNPLSQLESKRSVTSRIQLQNHMN